MADWVTISSLATADGTLVLAVATFSSVKSANRSARVAERAPLLERRSRRPSGPGVRLRNRGGCGMNRGRVHAGPYNRLAAESWEAGHAGAHGDTAGRERRE
jgi:hypothetical protein